MATDVTAPHSIAFVPGPATDLRFWPRSKTSTMPWDVPTASILATAKQVGVPKLRRPASEKTCRCSLASLVHLTTSQGADPPAAKSALVALCPNKDAAGEPPNEETLRLWRIPGVKGRGDASDGRAWKRRSNGRKEGVVERAPERVPGREVDEVTEPCTQSAGTSAGAKH